MWVKGLARCSWQKGSLPTVQISVSCLHVSYCRSTITRSTYGLELLLQLRLKGAGLEGNDLGGGIGVVGDGGTALGAEEAVDDLARGSLAAGVGLDGAVDGELVLLDDGNQG
jgi:hypothetical protein